MDHPPGRGGDRSGGCAPGVLVPSSAPRMPDEPQKKSHGTAISLVMGIMVLMVLVPWLFIRHMERRAVAAPAMGTSDELLAGQKVYMRVCVGCHEPRGDGRPGIYPSLVRSPWLTDDADTAIRIVLLGIDGPIESGGIRYQSVMPGVGVTLTDQEIAHLLTFCRKSFGNDAKAVVVEDVARVRASLGARTKAWAGGAELIEARKASAPH